MSLIDVVKTFSPRKGVDVRGLAGVSFSAHEGEFLVLLGPSGCGKSTSLRVIAGLEQPDEGEVRIDGRLVNDVPGAERHIAMVFQSYALFPHLTSAQNIDFGMRARRLERRTREQQVAWAAELLDITDVLDRKPAQLSGGQRQRVALGRALVNDASVVLMDEPLSNLDATLRAQMRREIRSLQRELGLTVIYVTHDQVEAMAMADRVVIMREGRVEQIGTPSQLYQEPATTFVARFVGSPPMNIFLVASDGKELRLAGDSVFRGPLPEPLKGRTAVHLGVRPEAVTLGEGFPVGVSGQVVAVEDLGSDTLVAVRLATDDLITVRSTRQSRLVPGSQVRCGWTWSDTNFFDVVDAHRIRLPDPPAAAEVDVSSLMNVSQIAQYQDEEEHEG